LVLWLTAAYAWEIDVMPHGMQAPKAMSFLQSVKRGHTHFGSLANRSETYVATAQSYCEKNFWLSLTTCTKPLDDGTTFVLTGDIPAMWIRDSSAQMYPYIGVAEKEGQHSQLRPLLEGTLRRQAQFMLTDPYANAFTMHWDSAKDDRLKRGGYVFTGNYELDDGGYFFRFLERIKQAFPDTAVLHEKPIKDATRMLIALYRQEQQHAAGESEYLYPKAPPLELPEGRGRPVKYTGMVWGAFRPSDDPQEYGYNIPGNLFLAATLGPIAHIANFTWQDQELADTVLELRNSIIKGAHDFGTKIHNGKLVYCYEVDGLGSCNLMDDANIPSLLSLPYLDPSSNTFDQSIYKTTREFILSTKNPWYFEGSAGRGIGSPHTGHRKVWPLALVMQAITAERVDEKMEMLQLLDQSGVFDKGLTESFDADDATDVTRPWFGWPNSLLAEFMMSENRCQPSLSELPKLIPATVQAPRLSSWQKNESFYTVSPERMMREEVTLPKAKFFPSQEHQSTWKPVSVQVPRVSPRQKRVSFHSTIPEIAPWLPPPEDKVPPPEDTVPPPEDKVSQSREKLYDHHRRIKVPPPKAYSFSSSLSSPSLLFIIVLFLLLLLLLFLLIVLTGRMSLVSDWPRAGWIKV